MLNKPLLLWVTSVLNFQKNTSDSSEVHTNPEMNLNDRLGGEENTFVSSDSVYLTDLLLKLDYDPMRVCRCAPVFEVTTEFGGPYGVNLSQGYAWCEKGQADLTQEQIEAIAWILESITASDK